MPLRSFFLSVIFLLAALPAFAETAMIQVDSLPLDEAAAAAQSQLSDKGRIATLPSRSLLIIDDDAAHIARARALLKKLDTPPAQLTMQVAVSEHGEVSRDQLSDAAMLPGGWIRIAAYSGRVYGSSNNRYTLRVSSGSAGHVRAGEVRVVGQKVRNYLAAHGIVSESSVETLDVTGGFDVQATLLANDQVRVAIHPWLRKAAMDAGMDAKTEMLLDSGSTQPAGQPLSTNPKVRINMQPHTNESRKPPRIMVAEAATELTVKLGEKVTLAASRSAAGEFSTALLGESSLNNRQDVTITLTVTKAAM